MPAASKVKVWDPLIRIFHWSLVISFLVAWLSAEESQAVIKTRPIAMIFYWDILKALNFKQGINAGEGPRTA